MSDYYTTEVEYRGRLFDIECYYNISSGGSNSYGSDEPAWAEVEITDIAGAGRYNYVSRRLYKALMNEYGAELEQSISEHHGG